MPIGILNNISSLAAENQLTITNNSLQNVLFQLSSGSRINSGADDAAGLAIRSILGGATQFGKAPQSRHPTQASCGNQR